MPMRPFMSKNPVVETITVSRQSKDETAKPTIYETLNAVLTTAARRNLEVDKNILIDDVGGGATHADDEVVW